MIKPNPSPDDAFERAAEDMWMPVYRFALAMTNDLAEADDIAQESFMRLWIHRDSIDWNQPIIGWLLVAARRIALDRFRRIARAVRLGRSPSAPHGIDAATIDRFVDLRAELARLTHIERTAILMSAVEGLSGEEIATALGVTPGAIRAAASRGRAKLALNR
jgi:RNA polymerase sigma-70 factor (ECF subfamily)